jgi:N12 class adenine-specific DNA methylase
VPRDRLARAAANLAAIEVLHRLERTRQAATTEDRRVLGCWSGWGSVPTVFAPEPDAKDPVYGQGGAREGRYQPDHDRWEKYSPVRGRLRELLDPFEWAAAARAILSAHYTPQALAETLWAGVRAFGFDGGEVLEAGCGAGVFFGTAPDLGPDAVRLTGVELDPTTARICAHIYPHATVLAESFADTDAPAGAFDLAIGNVPFAKVPFPDRRHPGHSLHNGFLVKQLSLVRPGGLVVAVTSHWTLDGDHEAARMALAAYGDLVGAWRLPAGVFEAAGVDDVVADVLVLRRRPEGQALADPSWLDAPHRELNGSTHTVSAWFDQHPEHVLGELTTRSGPFGPKMIVNGSPSTALATLATALQQTAGEATAAGCGYLPHPDGVYREPLALQTARDQHVHDYTGRLYRGDDGRIWQHINGADPIEAVPADDATGQLAALMQLRDVAVALKDLDRTGGDPAGAEVLRTQLQALYTAYTTAHGPLSRPHQTRLAASAAARAQARAEDRKVRDDERTLTAWGWFREDPDAAAVLALDAWDHRAGVPVRSEVLTRRPGTRRDLVEHTDDPLVALGAVMGATGRVDLAAIATLLDADVDDARRRLGTAVFDNPITGRPEHAGTYLSGAVRRKLDEARAAAATDPTFAVNVAALEAVQPPQRRLGQFAPQLGAHWIPAPLVQGFLRYYLADPTLRVDHDEHYGWMVTAGKVPDAVNAVKGTDRRSALQIARAVLGRGSLTVSDVVGDKGATEVNEDATRAVRQRADAMRSAFEEYLTADSTRVALLTDAYNRIMNGHVVRNYDGLAPTLTGFTTERTPHPHQLAGAARMQAERGVILAHEVGLGKTTTMIIGSQALKAAGQVAKPFVVAQRHLARQWLDEARFCYPAADVRLVTTDMLAGDGRRRTLEWLRSNTPDLVIFTEEAFTSVRMSPEHQERYEFRELADLREQILRERGTPDTALAVMRLEQRLATVEARLRRAAAPMRTPGELYWDDLGFDYALIDELHRFKGVGFRSREAGGSEARLRGIDLHQKLTYMHQLADAAGERPTVTGGTGTPLVNSIAEQYTLLALIAPQVLREYGVDGPDLWAETFGQRVQRIEMAPDGSGLKFVERFSRFTFKRAMKTMWGLVADTKRADDVGVPRPAIAGGGPRLELVDPTVDQQTRLAKLVARGAAIHAGEVTRDQDNMLAVTGEGRAVAVDARLVDATAPPGAKLAAVADWFAARYHASKDRVYAVSTSDPTPHPTPGALLIGFLNQGTPGGDNKGGFDAYAELRTLCAERGVPADRIAFAQDHNRTPDQLSELYRRGREGEASIILASTKIMGTGANLQNRALGLAHIDLDWTPAAMEQRDGRIVRWGNQNPEVEIVIFALRGSMDSWQAGLLASKAEGLHDIQRPDPGDDTSDTVLEVDDTEWDYATMAAEIGGNPYMGQLLQARADLAGLEADRRNHAADRLRQAELLAAKQEEAAQTRAAIQRRADALPMITPVRGDDFTITIGPTTYDQRNQAAPVLRQTVATTLMQHRTPGTGPWQVLGRFGGLPLGMRAELTAGQLQAQLGFADLRHSEAVYAVDDLTNPKVGATMLSRLATALDRAADHQHLDRERLPTLDAEIALLHQQQGELDFGPRIDHARRRVELLDNIVGAVVDRDRLPELRPEDLDTTRYPTEHQRQQAIADRRGERQPLQAKVDAAVAVLGAFDRDNPPPQADSVESGAPADEPQPGADHTPTTDADQTATPDARSDTDAAQPSPSPAPAIDGPRPDQAQTRRTAMRDLYAEAVTAGCEGRPDRHDPAATQAADTVRQADEAALSMIRDREPLINRHAGLIRDQTLGTAFAADRRGVQDLLRQVAQDPQRTTAHREAAAYYLDRIPADATEITVGSEAFRTDVAAVEADIAVLARMSSMLHDAQYRLVPDAEVADAVAAYDAEVAAEFGPQIPVDALWSDTRREINAAARRRAEAVAYTAAYTQASDLAAHLITPEGQACAAATLKASRLLDEDIRLRASGAEIRRDTALAEVRGIIAARVAAREAKRVAYEQYLAREAASPAGLDRADLEATVDRVRTTLEAQGGLRDRDAAAREDRRRLKKTYGIPADATLKQLPIHQRMAAEAAVRLINDAAWARIAAINNQLQATVVQAELDAHPDLRPNTRRRLEQLVGGVAAGFLATPAGAERVAQKRDRALAVWQAVAPAAGPPGELGEPTPEMLDGLDNDQRAEVWWVAEQIGIEAGRRLAAQWQTDTAPAVAGAALAATAFRPNHGPETSATSPASPLESRPPRAARSQQELRQGEAR